MRILARVLLVAVMLSLALIPGQAQDASGVYRIAEGSANFDGSPYTGKVTITNAGKYYNVAWTVAGNSSYKGVGLMTDNVLGVGWGVGGRAGVAVYRMGGNSLSGRWVDSSGNAGTEQIQVGSLSGTFKITGTSPAGTPYAGTIKITPTGETYSVLWQVERPFQGVGMRMGDLFIVAFADGTKDYGVVAYRPEGGIIRGFWTLPGAGKLAKENLSIYK